MENKYKIDIIKNNENYFSLITDENKTEKEVLNIYEKLQEKFPEVEGYKIVFEYKNRKDEVEGYKIVFENKTEKEAIENFNKIKNKVLKSKSLLKLKNQFLNNEIISFCIYDDNEYIDKHYTYMSDKKLYTRCKSGRGIEIDFINNKIKILSSYSEHSLTTDIYKDATLTLIEFLENLDDLIVKNTKRTINETNKVKNRKTYDDGTPAGIYKYFTKQNIEDMTLIADISNPCHWAWGCDYFLFVYKGRLFHFEAYDREAYLSPDDRTPNLINNLQVFRQVENTGEGNENLPCIKDLDYFDYRIYHKIDLDDLY